MLEAPLGEVAGHTFNAGSGVEISVSDTVELIAALMDVDVDIRVEDQRLRPERSEVTRLVSDSTAIERAASWKPSHTLAEGLLATIDWFSRPENLRRYRPTSTTSDLGRGPCHV